MDLIQTGTQVNTGNDSIVIQKVLQDIPGGKSLDVTGFTPTAIQAGHVVIKQDSNGVCKPHPVSGATYAVTPASHTVIGIVVASVPTNKAMVGIMEKGRVNESAAPYPYLSNIKTALDGITFASE